MKLNIIVFYFALFVTKRVERVTVEGITYRNGGFWGRENDL